MEISDDEILTIFESETSVDRSRLIPSATLESLDIASLDIIGVSFAIEDKFGIVVDVDAFAPTSSLQEIIAAIQAKARAGAPVAP